MKKILLLILLIIPLNVFATSFKSAIVVNRSNDEILYESNKSEELPIASLTKIMTAIVSLENIKSLSDTVTITKDDIDSLLGYQVIGLKEDDVLSYEELLYSTIMYSAADSAKALCNHVFNNCEDFINKMNDFANKLNMKNSHFSNSIGMDDNNYSSSYDLYLLLDYALNNENFRNIYTTKKYNIKSLDKSITNNINNAIKKNNIKSNNIYFDGYKGGYTNLSGLSFSGISSIDNNELIVITIGSDSNDNTSHIKDSISILSDIKDNYSNRVILENNKLVDNIIFLDNNKELDYEVKSTKEHKYFLKNDIDLNYIKVFYEGITRIENNIKNGDELGKIKIYYNDLLLDEESVVFNYKNIVREKRNYTNLVIVVVILLLGLVVFRKKKA